MSYDLAVWEGNRPTDNAAAADMFADLYERYIEADVAHPPTPVIREFIADLLSHWPDLTVDNFETSPWTVSGMADSGRGPLAYFGMRSDMAGAPAAYAAELAKAMDLVCYDPQTRKLRT